MADVDPSLFANKFAAWQHSQEQPWNRLRYLLVEATLRRLIGDQASLHVLDVGGGDGRDALPLARQGHTVLVLDYVSEMLAAATQRAAEAGLQERVAVQLANVGAGDLPVVPGSYDLVLCHNVLQYLHNPARLLQASAAALRPGGWFSLLVPNPASEALRQALQQHDLCAARASLDAATHRTILFDADIHLVERPALWNMLAAANLTPIDYYGVRCVNDYLHDDERKFSEEGFVQLMALELAMGQRSPYRDIARLWQIVARKPLN
ncbi:MAG: methyltransferase domain-containing protein [Caldilineaceae bacterium]|jgi:S-adenosylmethionine-dependent methyltransferase|nr:methyltransferase domain-containing protein [Caldilineaceae bacterium]